MSTTQVTTWRRYTASEKKAYRARQARRRRRAFVESLGFTLDPWQQWVLDATLPGTQRHHFTDNLGSRVPTMRVNGERL